LRGARQTGKTFLLRQFGDREYERIVYCNFEEDPALDGFFRRDLDPQRIVAELSVYKGFNIEPERHLIIFDEVQVSDRALTSLKYFREKAAGYHVAAAGSLLGIKMSRPGSFPVGKVNFLDLHPMSFLEFLRAMGKPRYAELLLGLTEPEPLPDAIHSDMIGLLRTYYFVGGMPEAIRSYAEAGDARITRQIQSEILDSYLLDFAKHAPPTDIPKLGLIWDSIPRHLAKENKKFMFSAVKKGARAREYENALKWLQDAGLVHSCYAVSTSRSPLKHYADRSIFKVYALDVGLLGAMARTPPEVAVQRDRLFVEYRGALAENYAAQELVAGGQPDLYFWRSAGGRAEIDFLYEIGGTVVPVEVKAGLSRRSKSLRSYDQQFAPDVLVRSNLLNLKRDGKICNVPLYAASLVHQFV
jgi:predicted AAA+ superfamily ATPase